MHKLKKITFFSLILLSLNSFGQTSMEGFILSGKTKNFSDGTTIYLYDELTGLAIDSTEIWDNKFKLQGILMDPPRSTFLQSGKQYTYLWLENTRMTFDASQSDFLNANFEGSGIHDWADEKLFYKIDSIHSSPKTKEGFNRVKELSLEFVEKYPESIISANILSIYVEDPELPLERIKYLYNKLSPKNKQHTYGQRISKAINTFETAEASNTAPQVGDKYVDFEMMNTSGNLTRLSDNLGDVTLLEFWAAWCGPCLKEMPNLKKTYESYKAKGFKIFAVSLDNSEEKWRRKIEEFDMNWIHVSDLNGFINTASRIYHVEAIPDNFLIDSNGKIIGRNLRGKELDVALDRVLNE